MTENENKNKNKPVLYVMVCNHFDPIWRRCFDRAIEYGSETFVSYADIEQYYIEDNIALCDANPEYKFLIESPLVARKYLDRMPEHRAKLVELGRAGRLSIPGTGDNIIDSNMVHGETIVRNFLYGLLWVENTFGQKADIAYRFDAFGNSAQLPQILRGCELTYVLKLSYTKAPTGNYWKGIDGSVVIHTYIPYVGWLGSFAKYPPCKVCRGVGKIEAHLCAECSGRGIDRNIEEQHLKPLSVKADVLTQHGFGYVLVNSEEVLPPKNVVDIFNSLKDRYEVKYARFEDALPHLACLSDHIDDPKPGDVHGSIEFNPNNTGCYVSRIKTKQNLRRQEYRVLSCEALAAFAFLKTGRYPSGRLNEIWNKILFTAFHDAVTGTHVDAAYRELEQIWREIDEELHEVRDECMRELVTPAEHTFTVINPTGWTYSGTIKIAIPQSCSSLSVFDENGSQVALVDLKTMCDEKTEIEILLKELAPFRVRTFTYEPQRDLASIVSYSSEAVIQNARFLITADQKGILSVYDKKLGKEIAKAGEFRPGEFILERDEGSPWETLSHDRTRFPLSACTSLIAVEKGDGYERLVFEAVPGNIAYNLFFMKLTYTVTLLAGVDRVDFKADVFWDSFNHRLRVAMPVPFRGKHMYEIPYAFMEREPYQPEFKWNASNGDWPAVNWAGVESGDLSVAFLNKGLPSYTMEEDRNGGTNVLLSVLRSPCIPTYLHEVAYYTMKEYDGMRDAGIHSFEYSFTAYGKQFSESSVMQDADLINAQMLVALGKLELPEVPMVESENVRITVIKRAEAGNALVVRLIEYRGIAGKACVTVPGNVNTVYRVNLLERQREQLAITNGTVILEMRAFEISTLYIEL